VIERELAGRLVEKGTVALQQSRRCSSAREWTRSVTARRRPVTGVHQLDGDEPSTQGGSRVRLDDQVGYALRSGVDDDVFELAERAVAAVSELWSHLDPLSSRHGRLFAAAHGSATGTLDMRGALGSPGRELGLFSH
jgi:hypothetical protein